MAFLNILSEVTVSMPTAWPWELLLNDTFTFIADVAWRIVFLTVCLKLILSPLDFYQRYKMRKNQVITRRLEPQMEKLKRQYAGNEKVLQQKQMELNKKSGMNMFASCLPMIVTLVVFIWLWQSLSNIAQYNQFQDYANMYNVYNDVYAVAVGETDIEDYAANYREAYEVEFEASYDGVLTVEEVSELAVSAAETTTDAVESYDALYKATFVEWFELTIEDYFDRGNSVETSLVAASAAGAMNAQEMAESYCVTVAQRETYNFYFGYGDYAEGGSKEDEAYSAQSFLWIKNAWSPDVPWTTPIKETQDDFETAVGDWATDSDKSGIEETVLIEMVSLYEEVTYLIQSDEQNSVNGWLILPLLALILNLCTQLVTRRQQKKSCQAQMTSGGQTGCMMNAMIIIMPVMLFVFALNYSAVFTLYMVTNACISLIINLVSTFIVSKVVRIEPPKTTSQGMVVEQYGRKAPEQKSGSDKSKK